jgi:RNA polymerase sigma factor (sigma-70 family)
MAGRAHPDAAALAELLAARGHALKGYAYVVCGDPDDAEDLVQDALVRAYASPSRSAADHPEAYVRRIILNLYVDSHRRRGRWRRNAPKLLDAADYRIEASAVLRHDLAGALAGLAPRQRACLVARYLDDLTVPQIGALLGIAEGTVKRHLSDGLDRLRPLLGAYSEEGR